MNTDYFPKELYNHLNGTYDYFCGAYKAASHNFTVSTDFEHMKVSTTTADVANEIFNQQDVLTFDLKARHFFSHVLVGTILLVPILNVFVFMGFESSDADPLMPPEIPSLEPKESQKDLEGNHSPDESTPLEIPKPQSRVVLEDSPHMHRLKRRNSKVSERALIFEKNKLNFQQQQIDASLPITDGARCNPVTIAEFREIEAAFTQEFFRLFPNETCDSQFASLRKRQEEESLGIVLTDSKYIESFILYTEGSTPEARFKRPQENLAALNQFIQNQFPEIKDNFYILGNFKNDMQNKIDSIPYIHIIKILFKVPLEEFKSELNRYKFVPIQAMPGEKTPVRIDTIEFQDSFKSPGTIKKKLKAYRNSVSNLK